MFLYLINKNILQNSNTTLVKVKSATAFAVPDFMAHSNTTLVKVKYYVHGTNWTS